MIAIVLISAGAVGPAAGRSLPLLTLLMVAEFGFFLNAIGAGLAIRQLIQQGLNPGVILSASGCALLAAGFAWLGLQLWPGAPAGVA